MPSEDLELNVETTWDDDRLEDLEEALREVDDQIRRTGDGGDNKVGVDVEVQSSDALTELEAIDSAIDNLNDKTVDVEVERDFSSAVTASPDGSTTSSPITADGRGPSGKRDFGKVFSESKVSDDEIDVTFDSPFETQDLSDEMGMLDTFTSEDAPEFTNVTVGEIDTDEVLQPRSGATGLAAEGIDRDASLDLLQAQRGADDFRDNRSLFAKLSGQAGDLAGEFKDARFTMEQFHAIFASLVPIAVVFIGAMPAAITALAGLAGAALAATAALGAIGLLGFGAMTLTANNRFDIAPLMERFRGIAKTFIEAFTPLMREFEPLVDSALTQLENLASPLAAAMGPLTQFRSTFNGLVNSIADGVPSFTRNVIAFGQAAMPILSAIAGFFADTEFMAFFADQLGRASLSLRAIAFGLKEIIPFVLNLSQGFLTVVGVLTAFVGLITGIIDVVPFLGVAIGVVTSTLLVMVSVTSLLTVLGFALSSSLAAQATAFLQTGAAAVASALGISTTTLAVIGLISAVTLGIAAIGLFAAGFDSLRERIGLATNELKKFNDVAGSSPDSLGASVGSPTGSGFGSSGGGNTYVTNIQAGDPDAAARQQYSSDFDNQHVDSVFGG